ncbi:hypothetical protein MSG28_010452 [Choristoneura fumiferana]|uniref:Uncharacterized protein n=1 Tax=Choristoneura fumiferana TaxID=7141 RepID=A0ACC0KKI4_CHOFU|nr:hypothetical protein MSG28_010452 [Choristoneura fumiferana]
MDQEFPYQHMFTPFVPTVEPAGTRDPFLNQYPFHVAQAGGMHKALGDRLFAVDVGKLAQIHAQKSGQPTYLYRYSFRGEKSLSNMMAANNKDYAWTPVTPGSNELNYLEIASPSRLEMKTSSDFGQRSFWNSLGFIENENYRHIRDEL